MDQDFKGKKIFKILIFIRNINKILIYIYI